MADGCDDFLRKPFPETAIFEKLREHLNVEFIYEADSTPMNTQPVDPARIAELPTALRDQLARAVAALDMTSVDAAIAEISLHDPVLGRSLAALAKKFEYRPIIELLK